jgi:general secretion pathway protein G
MRPRYLKGSKAGFTLIELIVVIVIIAILAAIIVPKFVGQVDKAAVSKTKANLEILRTAIQAYAAENNGVYPSDDLSELITAKYLRKIPEEGIKNKNTVVTTLDGTGGWYWDTTEHEIYPNLQGNDIYGTPYSEY